MLNDEEIQVSFIFGGVAVVAVVAWGLGAEAVVDDACKLIPDCQGKGSPWWQIYMKIESKQDCIACR